MWNWNSNWLRLYNYYYPNTVASFIVLINKDTKGLGGKHAAGKIFP